MNRHNLLRAVSVSMWPLWWLLGLVSAAKRSSAGRTRRRVLLVAHNELMARHLREIADLIRDDARVSLHVTRAPFVDRSIPSSAIEERVDATPVRFWRALCSWWDLVVFADHYPAPLFHPGIRKLFATHGLFAGINIGGSNYVYGARAVRRGGQPMYTRMLVAGPAERACALGVNSELRDALAVVGTTTVDRLLERQSKRAEIRASHGIGPHDRVVIIMSSWGEGSLIETVGPSIVDEAKSLLKRYRFFLTIHPNNYTRGIGRDWGAFMREQPEPGFHIIDRYESWENYLIAADLAVSDHTSLSLYFSQLLRPIVFIPREPGRFLPLAPATLLYEASTKLAPRTGLDAALREASSTYSVENGRLFARQLVAHAGEAEHRTREVVLELLSLQDPPKTPTEGGPPP